MEHEPLGEEGGGNVKTIHTHSSHGQPRDMGCPENYP